MQLDATIDDVTATANQWRHWLWRRVASRFPSNTSTSGCKGQNVRSSSVKNVYWWLFILGDEMFTPHANTVQLRKETYILQMWWIELKYGFYLQNPAYCPRIYLWIFDKYSSTSFWWLSVYQQNFTAKSIKYYNPPPSPPPRFVVFFALSFF